MKNIYLLISFVFTLLLAKNVEATSVQLTFTASTDDTVAGYNIYYDTSSHASGTCPQGYYNYANPIDVGTSTNVILTGLSENQTYYFQVTAYNGSREESDCSTIPGEQSTALITASTDPVSVPSNTPVVSSGGGGGSGGAISSPAPAVINALPASDITPKGAGLVSFISLEPGESLPVIETTSMQTALTEPKEAIKLSAEAKIIYSSTDFVDLSESNKNLYSIIIGSANDTAIEADKIRIARFIQDGTQTTEILGAGERAGVVNSYSSAFLRLPKTEGDWQDVVKISNGRWTDERKMSAENNAEMSFKKIYRRSPNRSGVKYDDNAVMVIAYGLRPANRKTVNELAAISSFKKIFNRTPSEANDWDIVRAIAYSGAKR